MESRVRTSSQQLSMPLEDMVNHGDPARPLAASLGWVRSDRLWTELTNILNAVGGGGSKTTDKRGPRLRSPATPQSAVSPDRPRLSDLLRDSGKRLEDQSGATVELPPAERRALVVGLALHERGRTAARHHDYPLALVLFLEADRQLSECRSSILKSVDNWAVLQLDVAWSYLCLRSLPHAGDAAARLARAEAAFKDSYGEDHARLIALKGSAANERVLLMRMYLLQGIVCYHQNKRSEARALLAKAETELNALRVDEESVLTLMELGWSRAAARAGLRAAAGHVDTAHHYLADRRAQRDRARDAHRNERQRRLLGVCEDGSQINLQLVEALVGMGYPRGLAICALRNSNNHVAEAVRLIQEQPELLEDSDRSSDDASTISSDDSNIVPDNKLVAELEAMGYDGAQARAALRMSRNHISGAVDRLVAGNGVVHRNDDPEDPSTSAGVVSKKKKTKKEHKKDKNLELLQPPHFLIKTLSHTRIFSCVVGAFTNIQVHIRTRNNHFWMTQRVAPCGNRTRYPQLHSRRTKSYSQSRHPTWFLLLGWSRSTMLMFRSQGHSSSASYGPATSRTVDVM
ncbi:hypothetical protein SFRURICE_014964 [Spodoptera frugiperda]|nr:hypothetical protein SFRURICE_014964 [Spodoptera frugiperda]